MDLNFVFFEYYIVAALVFYALSAVPVFLNARRLGSLLVIVGLFCNVAALASRGCIGGDWYLFPMAADELHLIPTIMAVCAYPAIRVRKRREALAVVGALIVVTFIAVVAQADPPVPTIKGKTVAATLFFVSEAVSVALFFLAAAIACAVLPTSYPVKESWNGLVLRGFMVFTLCQIMGAFWAFVGWSYPFSWSTRHLLSASIWCFYGAAIHARYMGMQRKSKALLPVIGIIPIVLMVYHHQIIELLGVLP